jgi:hypothetical protein
MDWIYLAQDRQKWRAVVYAVTKVRIILGIWLAKELLCFEEGHFMVLFHFHIITTQLFSRFACLNLRESKCSK